MHRCVLILLLGFGCVDAPKPVYVDSCTARESIFHLVRLAAAMDASNASDADSAQAVAYGMQGALPGRAGMCPHPGGAGTRMESCTANECTFSRYTPGPPFTISYSTTVTRDGDALRIHAKEAGSHARLSAWEVTGDTELVVTATAMHGRVAIRARHDLPASDAEGTIDYRDIGLDATGCPISGSVRIEQLAHDLESDTTEHTAGTTSFGGTCTR